MSLISLFDLDPEAYVAHPIHGDERTYSETNCYVDCLVELLHAAGLEPEAMLGGAAAVDFELDQWTFFKPTPGDLFRLYGIDLHEVQPYRGFPTLIATRLAARVFARVKDADYRLERDVHRVVVERSDGLKLWALWSAADGRDILLDKPEGAQVYGALGNRLDEDQIVLTPKPDPALGGTLKYVALDD